jgi:hypothetical protein
MTPGQEMVFTAEVRMQPVYSRSILGRYELSSWNMPVENVRMRRLDPILWVLKMIMRSKIVNLGQCGMS